MRKSANLGYTRSYCEIPRGSGSKIVQPIYRICSFITSENWMFTTNTLLWKKLFSDWNKLSGRRRKINFLQNSGCAYGGVKIKKGCLLAMTCIFIIQCCPTYCTECNIFILFFHKNPEESEREINTLLFTMLVKHSYLQQYRWIFWFSSWTLLFRWVFLVSLTPMSQGCHA